MIDEEIFNGELSDEEISRIIEKYEEEILSDIEQIDKKISLFNIETPDSLDKKINSLGLYPKTLKIKNQFYKKVSVIVLVLFISGSILFKPKIALAIKQIIFQVVSYQTKESLDINLYRDDNAVDNLEFYLPIGFKSSGEVDNFNTQKFVYKNKKDKFITINAYPENFILSIDNENYDQYEEIEIDNRIGKMIVKNGITGIIFVNEDTLYELESNLPKDEFLAFAKNIKIKKTGGT